MRKFKSHSFELRGLSWTFIFIAIAASQSLFSGNVTVHAKLDSNSIRIGEQTKLNLSISYHSDEGEIKILWPSFNDTLGSKHIEIVGKSKIDTTIPEKNSNMYELVQSQKLTITSFDSGFYAIPPLKFIVNGDSLHPMETEPLLLQVNNIQVDTTKAIKDIKPPLAVPYTWLDALKEYLPLIGWTMLGIAIIIAIAYYLSKLKKKKPDTIEEQPQLPPHMLALQELEKLREQKLWQEGKFKQYHSAISDIIRLYVERRFKVNAPEQTTDEILHGFKNVVIDNENREKLRRILILADLVKFAKEQPLPNENELSLTNAIEFVNGTLREERPSDNTLATIVSNENKTTSD